ncbi:MAG TPA: hypothetical protein VD971_03730 [Phycisphaerales bacterium]|nr:hypothetical protein [Phycisphaerales bacterium]
MPFTPHSGHAASGASPALSCAHERHKPRFARTRFRFKTNATRNQPTATAAETTAMIVAFTASGSDGKYTGAKPAATRQHPAAMNPQNTHA